MLELIVGKTLLRSVSGRMHCALGMHLTVTAALMSAKGISQNYCNARG